MTAIRELARRAGRYAVEVGGGVVAPVSVEAIADFRLAVGRQVDAAALERLQAASEATACYDRALDALARKARSARELERWLAEREHPRAAIAAAVERLQGLGLLDDLAFARAFARSRTQGRGFGPRRVVAELARRGVARATIDRVMAELADGEEADGGGASRAERERAGVRQAAERRLRALGSLAPEVARRRLTAWLVRRGYAPGTSAAVARELVR